MRKDEAEKILKTPGQFSEWMGMDYLDSTAMAKLFDNIGAARRHDPVAVEAVIDTLGAEFDRLVKEMLATWPEKCEHCGGTGNFDYFNECQYCEATGTVEGAV